MVTIHEADGPPTRALFTFGADGTVVIAEHPVVTPPGAPGVIFTSSGHGAWQASGPNSVRATFIALGSDGQGNLFAIVTFRIEITLEAGGQTFAGEFVATIADPGGNTLATFPGALQATRIVAEATAA
jgi:hypothetical protein